MPDPNYEIPTVLEDIPESEQHALLEKTGTMDCTPQSNHASYHFFRDGETSQFFGIAIVACI